MRAGPLSNSKVIALLNSSFVPVFTVNEDYATKGAASFEEKSELKRIHGEGYAAKKSVGSVHVFVLKPDGHFHDSLHVATAAKTADLLALLEKAVADLKITPGLPVIPPACQSRPPTCDPGGLVLHLTARSLDGRGAWGEFPVENWIMLTPSDLQTLAPPSGLKVGATWEIDRAVSEKLLTHFYPATENNDVSKNRFDELHLRATVVPAGKQTTRVRLDGKLKMFHSFYHKEDGKVVQATIVGYLDLTGGRVTSALITTDEATYGGGKFGVAVRSLQ